MKYLLVNADDHTLDAAPRLALMRGWLSTGTKQDADPAIGLHSLRDWMTKIDKPVVAIGGIDAVNTSDIFQAGANGIAVVSAICAAVDPAASTRELGQIIHQARNLQ